MPYPFLFSSERYVNLSCLAGSLMSLEFLYIQTKLFSLVNLFYVSFIIRPAKKPIQKKGKTFPPYGCYVLIL